MTSLNARILIVDDEPMLRRTMSDRMKFWDCETEEASSGEEALEMLGRKSYDLVLLDLKMPGISGIEVMKAMRERNDLTDVVVLTAHGSVEAAVEAIKCGATDFLLKPADFELVLPRISGKTLGSDRHRPRCLLRLLRGEVLLKIDVDEPVRALIGPGRSQVTQHNSRKPVIRDAD